MTAPTPAAATPAPAPTRVLVTGASGFVGGALLERLRHDPSFAVRGTGRRRLDDELYRSVDLTSSTAAEELAALAPFEPDVIVHAAARSAPWGTAAEFTAENVEATRAVVRYAVGLDQAPRLVFVSTASVLYEARDQLLLRDDAPLPARFVNRYAATKAEAEEVVRGYRGEWVVLRPRAVFGPGDTTLYPRLAALAERGRLPRFGEPHDRPVLSDLVYIDTLVEYLVRALTADGVPGRTLAVTNAQPVPLQATLARILTGAGLPAPTRIVSRRVALAAATAVETAWRVLRRRGEPPITRYSIIVSAFSKTFDVSPCLALLGPPAVTLDEGIERFVASLREAGE
ncbi:NAD-dependent epimerase/dehydratase family protein [Herbiconiux sp. KACC 21604]|uniref:NAD-dependent epimerase/dehydratase family protein n=1 Tax=unclassified Herbiconiux TaxID=2618217 RepID=UPI0014923A5C|nr:NAD-dependent epimerase/dehydratase family protein [Herbiconiux sp. SALV-R1]QJU53890.1 NAD-dependent epimerase/dehydratase family protein [Herbiconiux sp. SALV-R1]WPO84907.1 NAD-dependent epimerase/dehydratase family protein [Herbiconiux sp. KACC 21604]